MKEIIEKAFAKAKEQIKESRLDKVKLEDYESISDYEIDNNFNDGWLSGMENAWYIFYDIYEAIEKEKN